MKHRIVSVFVASALLAAPAFAQTTSPATDPTVEAPSTSGAAPVTPTATPGEVVIVVPEGYVLTELTSVTSDQLKGVNVYDQHDSKIAEIADVVIGADSKVTGVITDVGGFLGIGEHRVSLSPEQVKVYKNSKNDIRAYVSMSKDELKALPEFKAPNQ
ncbi:PRC-barrel domain-containing protein [Paracoccus aminophilus]|nr:PRC-barrel domain-containing protein [Paracoccus aminophilus]